MNDAKKDESLKVQADGLGMAEDEADYVDDVSEAIERLTAERDDMRDRWMRALADAENSRKRGEKDQQIEIQPLETHRPAILSVSGHRAPTIHISYIVSCVMTILLDR